MAASPPLSVDALGHEIVTLVVGSEKEIFAVHKKLLCDRSEYFSKAFGGQFKEATEGRMELPNDTPAAIKSLVTWLYWDKMPTVPSFNGDAVEQAHNYCQTVLYAAFILAEKLCLIQMANKVIDEIQDFQEAHFILPRPEDIKYIYDNTAESSRLRIYCVTAVAFTLSRRNNHDGIKEFARLCSTIPDFAVDLLTVHHFEGTYIYDTNNASDPRVRAKANDQRRTTKFVRCHFHTHEPPQTLCSPVGDQFDWDNASEEAMIAYMTATANASLI